MKYRMEQGRPERGFTLIEVILATVILSTGLVVLLTSASHCLAVMRAAGHYQNACWVLGLGEAEHPILQTEDPMELEVEPVVYGDRFTFSREVEEVEEESDRLSGLYILRTRISWADRGGEVYEEVTRYVLQSGKIRR